MLFKILKSDDYSLLDIELDIIQESYSIGNSKIPQVAFYNYENDYYIVDTEESMHELMKTYNAMLFVLKDNQSLGEAIQSDMDTIYKKFENCLFKSRDKKWVIRSLPKNVYETFDLQNDTLKSCLTLSSTGQLHDEIRRLTRKFIEEESKLTWTVEEYDKGKAYLLQYRTPNLRILVKIASNNFGNMFVKVRYPPSGDKLEKLKNTCEQLKYQLFGSILKGDAYGLVDFYNKIIEEF